MQHEEIVVKILKMDQFCKRNKDIERLHWFSMPIDLLTHPDFFNITGDELKAFIWFISVAIKCKTDSPRMNLEHTCHLLNISKKTIHSMVEKLKGKQVDVALGPPPVAVGPDTASTLHNITEHNITNITEHIYVHQNTDTPDHDLPVLIKLWNEHCGSLPKVRRTNLLRTKKSYALMKSSEISIEDWIDVIKRLNESDFCRGKNDNGWIATFDFLLKPDTYLKVLEGKFDNRTKMGSANKAKLDFSILKKYDKAES